MSVFPRAVSDRITRAVKCLLALNSHRRHRRIKRQINRIPFSIRRAIRPFRRRLRSLRNARHPMSVININPFWYIYQHIHHIPFAFCFNKRQLDRRNLLELRPRLIRDRSTCRKSKRGTITTNVLPAPSAIALPAPSKAFCSTVVATASVARIFACTCLPTIRVPSVDLVMSMISIGIITSLE